MKVWRTNPNVEGFIASELRDLFAYYWRDLLQSQADHHESVVEKNTALSVVEQIAMKYTIPITSGPRPMLQGTVVPTHSEIRCQQEGPTGAVSAIGLRSMW